ncbi:type VI immunity family protein [Myxococcus fulvus]|uniref:type VI immunity family protein n=1 Tax=Myxococcus fulvus TaxID=33 RepID=UPI003B9C7CD1
MTAVLPSIRVADESGEQVVREGLSLCFFMRHSHSVVADKVWRALELYRRAIPSDALGWYGSDDGDTLPLDADGWRHIHHQLVERAWGVEWLVELTESSSGPGGYQFEYDGRRLEDPLFSGDADATTGIRFCFPTEYLTSRGVAAVRDLALNIARELPFSFGYASPALVARPGAWFSVRRQLLELLQRHPGLDLLSLTDTSRRIGVRARGAYWLTFLGPKLLGQLGGAPELNRRFAFPGISLAPLDEERWVLTLGELPDVMDSMTQPVPAPYRELARLLEPFLLEEGGSWPPWDANAVRRWLRRHGA